MLGGINPAVLIASLMVASVPIILAAIGELVVEKAGHQVVGFAGTASVPSQRPTVSSASATPEPAAVITSEANAAALGKFGELEDKNVTSLALEVPASCLTATATAFTLVGIACVGAAAISPGTTAIATSAAIAACGCASTATRAAAACTAGAIHNRRADHRNGAQCSNVWRTSTTAAAITACAQGTCQWRTNARNSAELGRIELLGNGQGRCTATTCASAVCTQCTGQHRA